MARRDYYDRVGRYTGSSYEPEPPRRGGGGCGCFALGMFLFWGGVAVLWYGIGQKNSVATVLGIVMLVVGGYINSRVS